MINKIEGRPQCDEPLIMESEDTVCYHRTSSPIFRLFTTKRDSYIRALISEINSQEKKLSDMQIKFSTGKKLKEDLDDQDLELVREYLNEMRGKPKTVKQPTRRVQRGKASTLSAQQKAEAMSRALSKKI